MKLFKFMIFSSLASNTMAKNDGMALNGTYDSVNTAESFNALLNRGFELNPVYRMDENINKDRNFVRNARLAREMVDAYKSKNGDFFSYLPEIANPILDRLCEEEECLGRKWLP